MKEKENIHHGATQIILFGLFLFLFIPILFCIFLGNKNNLNGAFNSEDDPSFSWQDWFKGNYQEQKDKYIKQNFGWSENYIRFNNQLEFDLFNKAHAKHVVIGKENYLYEIGYINSYYGKDFIGTEKINDYVKKLKQVQDSLEKQNKLIMVFLAPGKASFYPEYIPDSYKIKPLPSNYSCFAKSARELKLNIIDFNKYFTEQKNKSKYPLYPQFGIHWSAHASILAFDSILKSIEAKLKVDLPDLKINSVHFSDTLKFPDDDIIKGMNLLREPKTFRMVYADYKINYNKEQHKKINLLVVADSFWWYIYGTGLPNNTFASNRFWYYNEEMYPESSTEPTYVSQTDYYSEIREADVIIILQSESTLYKFGNGFVDMCYRTYCEPDKFKEQVQKMKGTIRATPPWFKTIQEKAEVRNITIDSMLTLDALFTLEQEKTNK